VLAETLIFHNEMRWDEHDTALTMTSYSYACFVPKCVLNENISAVIKLYETDSLRSWYFLGYSRKSPHFTDPNYSSSCPQNPSTYPYSVPDKSSPHCIFLFNVHFNIIIPYTPTLSKWSQSFGFQHKIYVYIYRFPILHPSHLFDLTLLIIRGLEL